MEVFLSWSESRSEAIARMLYDWLPLVLQSVTPFMSREIQKGSRWDDVLSDRLERTGFGILCLTPENLGSEWLLFEAGALSKKAKDARVCTYLYDLQESEIAGPLSRFQHTRATKEDTARLVATLNSTLGESALSEQRLAQTYEQWWPNLESRLNEVNKLAKPVAPPNRTTDEKIDELLVEVRGLRRASDISTQRVIEQDVLNMLLPRQGTAMLPGFEPYVQRAYDAWRERSKLVASVTVEEPPETLDVTKFACRTHRMHPALEGSAGGPVTVHACCGPFAREIALMMEARRDLEESDEHVKS